MYRSETRHKTSQAGRAVHAKTMTVKRPCSADIYGNRHAQAHKLIPDIPG
jgi:hypothetical protein